MDEPVFFGKKYDEFEIMTLLVSWWINFGLIPEVRVFSKGWKSALVFFVLIINHNISRLTVAHFKFKYFDISYFDNNIIDLDIY